MKLFLNLLSMKLNNRLAFKMAAISGAVTQLFWGILQILLYHAFYSSNPSQFPISFSAVVCYIWFQQAFISLTGLWNWEYDIFESIKKGEIVYELARPISIFSFWFQKSLASRVANTSIKAPLILLCAFFLPGIFSLKVSGDLFRIIVFFCSFFSGLILSTLMATCMYLLSFYTIESKGLRLVYQSIGDFLVGAVIPLPFLPIALSQIINLLPFASISNTPYLIYSGAMGINQSILSLCVQLLWIILFSAIGKTLEWRIQKRIVIQGG